MWVCNIETLEALTLTLISGTGIDIALALINLALELVVCGSHLEECCYRYVTELDGIHLT